MKKWIINAIVAAIAALIAILQEKWVGTQMGGIGAIGYGTVIGCALSLCTEIGKSVWSEWGWSWRDIVSGTAFGFIVSLITAFAVC